MSGRIRTIKPELLEDAVTAGVTHAAFRLYVGCMLLADDYGNFRADPRKLRGDIFWAHDTITAPVVEALIYELWFAGRSDCASGLFYLYTARGQTYGHIRNWEKHQKIDRIGTPRCEGPNGKESQEYRPTPLLSSTPRDGLAPDQEHDPDHDLDQRSRSLSGSSEPASRTDVPVLRSQDGDLPASKPIPNPPTEPSTPEPPSATASQLTLSTGQPTGQPELATATADAVQRVYEHYVAAWKRHIGGVRAPKLDEKRRKALRGRLREKFTVEELSLACDGIFLSPFHMGDNAGKKRFIDLELVCRDAKRVEAFMAIASEPRTPTVQATEPDVEDGDFVPMPPEAREAAAKIGLRPRDDLSADLFAENTELGSNVRLRKPTSAAAGTPSRAAPRDHDAMAPALDAFPRNAVAGART